MAKEIKKVEKAEDVTPEVKIIQAETQPVLKVTSQTLAELEAGKKALAKQADNR